MTGADNQEVENVNVTLERFLGFLAAYREKHLVFFQNGKALKPGYHVTEVKAGHFNALDCGANPESWAEMFVQLLDAGEEGEPMPAGKFSAIIRKVSEHVKLDQAAKLTFEVSDGVQPIQIYHAAAPQISGNTIHVSLLPRPASCKPRDRWLATQQVTATCCTRA